MNYACRHAVIRLDRGAGARCAGRLGCAVALAGALLAAACEDYATVEQMRAVEGELDRAERQQVSAAVSLGYQVSAAEARVGFLETRQQQTEQVVEAMGEGFNTLSTAVDEADRATAELAQRQSRLEQDVEAKLAPPLKRAADRPRGGEASTVFYGVGRDLAPRPLGGEDPPEDLILDMGPPATVRIPGPPGTDDRVLAVQEVGTRIYATVATPPTAVCLEVIDGTANPEGFQAARCDEAFVVYEFRRQ